MLVDKDQAHCPQPELLDPRDNLDRRLRLLIRVQLVPLDEPRRSQTQTLAHLTHQLPVDAVASLRDAGRTTPRENTRSI